MTKLYFHIHFPSDVYEVLFASPVIPYLDVRLYQMGV